MTPEDRLRRIVETLEKFNRKMDETRMEIAMSDESNVVSLADAKRKKEKRSTEKLSRATAPKELAKLIAENEAKAAAQRLKRARDNDKVKRNYRLKPKGDK